MVAAARALACRRTATHDCIYAPTQPGQGSRELTDLVQPPSRGARNRVRGRELFSRREALPPGTAPASWNNSNRRRPMLKKLALMSAVSLFAIGSAMAQSPAQPPA